MRRARLIASFESTAFRVVLAGGLSFLGSGCHHHYYYYGNPSACPPGTALPSAVSSTVGPVCDVPTEVVQGGTTVVSGPQPSTVVENGRRPRVVVSEPYSGSGKSKSRLSWRSSDVESPPAITHVDGGLDDSTVK
jgi:hypothetical protein